MFEKMNTLNGYEKINFKCSTLVTYLLVVFSKTLSIQFVDDLRYAYNIARGIFNGHAQQSFGPVTGLGVDILIKSIILQLNRKQIWMKMF